MYTCVCLCMRSNDLRPQKSSTNNKSRTMDDDFGHIQDFQETFGPQC